MLTPFKDGELLTAQRLNDSFGDVTAQLPLLGTTKAAFGDATPEGARLAVQGGQSVYTTNVSARFTVNFNFPFPNGVISVVMNSADVGSSEFIGIDSITLNNAVGVAFYKGEGKKSGLVRINWLAIGW